MFLLSVKAGLRAKEIASLTWAMLTEADGQMAEMLWLRNRASQGRRGGCTMPLHPALAAALQALQTARGAAAHVDRPVIFSEWGWGLSATTVQLWFHQLYLDLGLTGCSSHSGRRTFITRAARKVSEAGGSRRDVQELAGHASLSMTQRYIEGDSDVKRKLIALLSPPGRA